MRRVFAAVVVSSALLASALLLPATGQAQGERSVVVTLSCPPTPQGAVTVTVNPWTYDRTQGEDSSWILNTNGDDARIEIRAKDGWPYAQSQVSGNGRVTVTGMQPNATGVYEYAITLACGDEQVVIDPKMRVE